MSTLQRETNPKSGYAPSLLPQHESKNGAYLPTGENNPLPAAGYIQTAAGLYIPQKGTDDGSANVNVKNLPTKQDVKIADQLPSGSNNIGAVVPVSTSGNAITISSVATANDAIGVTNNNFYTSAFQSMFNGGTWDRMRNNYDALLLASASRTASTVSPQQVNYNGRGVILCFNVTAVPATTETLLVGLKVTVNGYTSYTFANLTIPATIGTYYVMIYPGIAERDQNLVKQISAVVPRSWYASIIPSGSSAWTYSVSQATIL